MAKGIIYIMTTAVPGLIKIGRANTNNYVQRMYHLEHNGYCNVTSLKPVFAIEVEEYDKKEKLLHALFAQNRVANTELFSINVNLMVQLLSSFDGKVVFPENTTQQMVFETINEKSQTQEVKTHPIDAFVHQWEDNGYELLGSPREVVYSEYIQWCGKAKIAPKSKLEFTRYICSAYKLEVLTKYSSTLRKSTRTFVPANI